MKHLTEEQLVLYHYNDDDFSADTVEHLRTCEICRTNLESLRRLLNVVHALPVPERSRDYGQEVWQRVASRIAAPMVPRRRSLLDMFHEFAVPRWALAPAMALLLAAAFLAGRFWPRATLDGGETMTTVNAPISEQARERILLTEIGNHLERSQLALIELIHTRTNRVVDISAEQALARQLVKVNRLYRQAAARIGETGMESVLDDLERTLIQIAHSPSQLSADEFAEWQQRFGEDDLLFKVKVLSRQLREQEEEAARHLAGGS